MKDYRKFKNCLALIGTFLPVPIAFDVIVAAILYNSGLPIQYVMILLLTLGTYSIYAFFIVKQSVSFKVAGVLYIGVAAFGIMAGTIGYFYDSWSKDQMRDLYAVYLTKDGDTKLKELGLPVIQYAIPDQDFVSELLDKKPTYNNVQASFPPGISVSSRSFTQSKPGSGFRFKKVEGMELGINESPKLTLANFLEPFSYGHSIASGDVHGDGWTDVLLSSDQGMALYANIEGTSFKRQWIDTTQYAGKKISTAALVDLNNDGWLDLYVVNSSFQGFKRDDKFLFRNLKGQQFKDVTNESGLESFFAMSAYTYLDKDNDGDLDIIAVPAQAPVFVYLNESEIRNSIAFQLDDSIGNSFGIGSKIIIRYGDKNEHHQMRELQSGGGFRSYDTPEIRFGPGEYETVNAVEILWSTGEIIRLDVELSSGATYRVSKQKSAD